MGMRKQKVNLTDDQVRGIVGRINAGEKQMTLAREFGVTQSTLSHIVRGKNRAGLSIEKNKICPDCGTLFARAGSKIYCGTRPCNRARMNKKAEANQYRWQKEANERKSAILRAAKDVVCPDCIINVGVALKWPIECMDLDHLDPDAKHPDLRSLTNKGMINNRGLRHLRIELLPAEIAKCEAVCSNCHRIRTEKRRRADAAARAATGEPRKVRRVGRRPIPWRRAKDSDQQSLWR